MRKELQSLIDSFDYEKALKWYLTHVQGKFWIKEMLKKGPDKFNILKLKKELNGILGGMEVGSKEVGSESSQQSTVHRPHKLEAKREKEERREKSELERLKEDVEQSKEELLDEIEALKERLDRQKTKIVDKAAGTRDEMVIDAEWKKLYKEANHHFEQISHIADPETRKLTAFKILDLMDEVEKLWWKKDFVKAHGKLPDFEDKGIEQLSAEQLATRIRTLRTYISKARKGKLNSDKIPDWETEIAELERRLRG